MKVGALNLSGKNLLLILPVIFIIQSAQAQQSYFDSLLNATLAQDSIFLDEMLSNDSQSILDLIDSMIVLTEPTSSLSARISYTSNIAYAGRNFGVQQYGFAGGLSYYHKSGLFADVTGFWNSELSPSYNPTITTLGYIGTIGKKFSYIFNYDHYFYQKKEGDDLLNSYPLTNALSSSGYIDFKPLTIGTDYSFLFGTETAHRIRVNLIKKFKWHNKGIFDRISLSPGVSALAGNQNLFFVSQSYRVNEEEVINSLIEKYGYWDLRRLRRNNPELFKLLVAREIINNSYVVYEESKNNVFGLINYSISIPIYFTINNFTVGISYSLNIPVSLPGETIDYEPNSYFNVSLIYNLFFK